MDMTNPEPSMSAVPPVEWAGMPPDEPATTWPRTIGVISLIYACGGLLCSVGFHLSFVFTPELMGMAGMTVQMPALLKSLAIGETLVIFALGILLLCGAMALLRRKRSGWKLLRLWALLRVLLLFISIALTVAMPAENVSFARSIKEAQAQAAAEGGQKIDMGDTTDGALWQTTLLQAGIFTAVLSIYPVFLMFYLSRRRITAEVEQWR